MLPPVERNLGTSRHLNLLNLGPGRADYLDVEVKPIGLPRMATPEEAARSAHAGELYFAAPDQLVTVNGTIVAKFVPPPNRPPSPKFRVGSYLADWIKQMTRAQLVEQVEASRRQNPDSDGRHITVHRGERYLVIRSDGKGFLMHISELRKDGIDLTFLYLGHLRLAPIPKSGASPLDKGSTDRSSQGGRTSETRTLREILAARPMPGLTHLAYWSDPARGFRDPGDGETIRTPPRVLRWTSAIVTDRRRPRQSRR